MSGGILQKYARGCMENSTRYEVVFEGGVLPGSTATDARKLITEANLMSPLKAAGIIFDGSLMVLFSSESKSPAFRAMRKFREAGLECWVRKRTEAPAAARLFWQKGILSFAIIVLLVFLSILALARLLGS